MVNLRNDQIVQIGTMCEDLLYELQLIWDEVGEPDAERDKMLLELEQECLEVYRRKVDHANRTRAQLRQAIADTEAQLVAICSAMGERPVHLKQNAGSLKEELKTIIPQLEEMNKRKSDRLNQFHEVINQIRKTSIEIGAATDNASMAVVDESDLSIRRLEELHRYLHSLQKEKSDRLKLVLDHLNTLSSLCVVLGIDFKQTVSEVHPSLETEGSKNISNGTIERLESVIKRLREVKIERMQKLQDLATTMLELWNLMDTPVKEQQLFQNVTSNIAASEEEITEPNTLSVDFIHYVGQEVSRLEELKASKMKELVLKKKAELEELRRRTHLVSGDDSEEDFTISAIEADPALVLEQLEARISSIKEEAFSRKEVLERVEKWLTACEEESWLEEYNRDENRYSAGRGAHLALKRAEKARAVVNKIPAIVDTLSAKITAWEKERRMWFTYDGLRLVAMLEEYNIVRQQKEEERRRQRDQKKLQGQLIAEQEALFGSKPSPLKSQSAKKFPRTSTGGASRRLSVGCGAIMQPAKAEPPTCARPTRTARKGDEWVDTSPARNVHKRLPFNAMTEREAPRKPFNPLLAVNSVLDTPPPSMTPVSKTPSMQMATTPCNLHEGTDAAEMEEYSFEERRLEFCMGR